eukprot:4312696-Amphidinium_carterae.1
MLSGTLEVQQVFSFWAQNDAVERESLGRVCWFTFKRNCLQPQHQGQPDTQSCEAVAAEPEHTAVNHNALV